MKKSILITLLLSSFSTFAISNLECYQVDDSEGSERFAVRFQDDRMAIFYADNKDNREIIYFDSAKFSKNTEYSGTIFGGRYIVKLDYRDNGYFVGALYEKMGKVKVELGSELECYDNPVEDIDSWVVDVIDQD